jgi:hypothetical protein
MNDQRPHGKIRLDDIARRLQSRFIDSEGRHASEHEVDELVASTARRFAEAPLQDFVPLLVEHQAADALRTRGMRLNVDQRTTEQVTAVRG